MFIRKLRFGCSVQILSEFNSRYSFLQKGIKVIELGSGKGEWTQFIVDKVHSDVEHPSVIAVDEVALPEIDGVTFIKGDVFKKSTIQQIQEALDLHPVDMIISNLNCKNTEEERDLENFNIIQYHRQAINIAIKTLKTGGAMLIKVRDGEPEKLNYKYLSLYFREFYKLKPTTIELPPNHLFYLGAGFKLRDEYIKYPKFFKCMQEGKEGELLEEDIPSTYQTSAERDLEVLEFLEYISKHQIEITSDYIDEVKQHPRFKTLNWSKYDIRIVPGPLTPYQLSLLTQAQYAGRLSFNARRNQSYEEIQAEYQQLKEKMEKEFEEKDRSKDLLNEGEHLGQEEQQDEQVLQMKNYYKHMNMEESIDNAKISEEDIEAYRDFEAKAVDEFISKQYPNSNPKEIMQKEIDKGNVTVDELADVFEMNEDALKDKASQDFNEYLERRTEKITQNLTKEYRGKHYDEKKKVKSRRQ